MFDGVCGCGLVHSKLPIGTLKISALIQIMSPKRSISARFGDKNGEELGDDRRKARRVVSPILI